MYPLRRGVLDTTLCDKVCQWFSPGTPVSSTNKTDHHGITEILLKVALNTITLILSMNGANLNTQTVMVSFIGGGNQSTRRKPLTNFIT
jgi:hypothetical protein